MTESRTDRLRAEFEARRATISSADAGFLRAVETSDDPDEIIRAARQSLEARGELRAIELATKRLADLGVGDGAGSSGRQEAARRFGTKGA